MNFFEKVNMADMILMSNVALIESVGSDILKVADSLSNLRHDLIQELKSDHYVKYDLSKLLSEMNRLIEQLEEHGVESKNLANSLEEMLPDELSDRFHQ